MLKLTKKADYGLIALRHLAGRSSKAAASAKDIAEAYRIPLPLLSKVLQKLTHAGLLISEQRLRQQVLHLRVRMTVRPQALQQVDRRLKLRRPDVTEGQVEAQWIFVYRSHGVRHLSGFECHSGIQVSHSRGSSGRA